MPLSCKSAVFTFSSLLFFLLFLCISPPPLLSCQDSLDLHLAHLDSTLKANPKDSEALLERGRVLLAAGRPDEARVQFNLARNTESKEIIARARIGLGDVYRVKPNRKWWAIREYRMAMKADSAFRCEGLYKISQTAFELGWTHGYNVACDALTELVCLDPKYKNVLKIWWEKIFTQSDDELRDVCRRFDELVDQGSENRDLLIYMARIRSRLGQPDSVMVALGKLETLSSEHRRSERLLLEAQCQLVRGDTLGFEECYNESLRYAEQDDDFTHLIRDSEPIFNPTETAKWDSLETPAGKSAFFHTFWKRRDPDPTTPHNERLLTHYRRLNEAKKKYWDYTPHSLFMTSYTYYRLMASRPVYSYDNPYFDSEYDPDLWWDNCRPLALQQRGLFYIRHGEPDVLYSFGFPWDASLTPPSYEAWQYGTAFFLFNRKKGFYAASKSYAEQGNITVAMNSETYKDPLPRINQAFYGVDFRGEDGRLEVEFYQSIPVSVDSVSVGTPGATVVVYDSLWRELVRRERKSQWVFTGRDSMCIAVNSVQLEPGPMFYALRMDVPGYRSVVRRNIDPTPYSGKELELSGVILGSPPPVGVRVHRRMGVNILPRPSLTFRQGELISVYLEVYGLASDRNGGRSFRENVTVGLEGEMAEKSLIQRIFGGRTPRTSLTLSFDRVSRTAAGPLAETFNIDTSDLVPGRYSLKIAISDNASGQENAIACGFMLVE
ncbi:MAG: GWxTD domain-containing protein [Candidatus Glassbacteria bacterium]|nr:GWxTD domain-containing protein [Candidatus Glassbacteria bacterium]